MEQSMRGTLAMGSQLAHNAVRFGWYALLHRLIEEESRRTGYATKPYAPKRPVPSRREVFSALRNLLVEDARMVRDGLASTGSGDGDGLLGHFAKLQAMFSDLPNVAERRAARQYRTAAASPDADVVPEYFRQDFHFQTDGYLSDESARLYDVQVETLFYGAAAAMRRAALRPLAQIMRGRDQRRVKLMDVACGTGRLLRDIRLMYPALKLTGVDLSPSYLREAERSFKELRPATWIHANAEELPADDCSQNIVTSVFLFHELPRDVRHQVAREMVRVMAKSGTLILVDSLQLGDRPGWDGVLEAFPERFHEPYYRDYTMEGLSGLFEDVGLEGVSTSYAFLSKIVVGHKPK